MTRDRDDYQAIVNAPFGALGIRMRGAKLLEIDLLSGAWAPKRGTSRAAAEVASMVEAYLNDPAIPMEPPIETQGTPFQQRVWQRLRQIPVGSVLTYGELARQLSSSPRAVGNACRANPCPVIVPCHRVVSVTGLGGFAGQRQGEKLTIKQWLLSHEGYLLGRLV
jgi:methylated-DNA-[protein]-cysteine S-methyltransferase